MYGAVRRKAMQRIVFMLMAVACAESLLAQSQQDIANAALRLKQDQVARSLQTCQRLGHPEDQCKRLLELIHQRELKVMERLAAAQKDPKINQSEFAREIADCYSPNYDYTQLVECQNQLADRLDAAHKGQFLLKR
jgi:Ni/Co efflux regulator RcnB